MIGEKFSLGLGSRSVTMTSCLQTDGCDFCEGKGGGVFASNHSRAEREALGFSSLQVLSLQLPVSARELKLLPWFFIQCCVIWVKPALDLPVPPASPHLSF